MVDAEPPGLDEAKPMIAAIMFGVTTACVTKAREIPEQAGLHLASCSA
jgi:uncharacterized protein (UPF0261 family)